MSKPTKLVWVLYQVTDHATLASSAGLPDPDITPIEDFCEAIFLAEKSLEESHGIRMIGVWDAQRPDDTINRKNVERTP